MDQNLRITLASHGEDKSECQAVELEVINHTHDITERLGELEGEIEDLDISIDQLTNESDKLDYIVAVSSGIIAGLIDIIWVGEFSIDRANEWGKEKVDSFVVKIAQGQGYEGTDLEGAIRDLEKKFPIAADKVTKEFGGGLQHHLRDFSHHPTPIGLLFSLLTQFTRNIYGTDVTGVFKIVPVDSIELIGENFAEKITFGVIKWFFHMVSDMAGSSTSASKGKLGTGLPGPLVSFLKEISALPIFRNMNTKGYKEFSVWISKLFNGTLLAKRDAKGKVLEAVKFDLRTEIGIAHEIGRQAIPVIVNECIVRGFYFVRRLFAEIKGCNVKSMSDLGRINWSNTLPFKNRTVARMITISTTVFAALDIADSAIRAGGFNTAFVLRINFVGIGRFTIALGTDTVMGLRKGQKSRERMLLKAEALYLMEAKLYYGESLMWAAVEDANQTIDSLLDAMKRLSVWIEDDMNAIQGSIAEIERIDVSSLDQNNDGLSSELLDIL